MCGGARNRFSFRLRTRRCKPYTCYPLRHRLDKPPRSSITAIAKGQSTSSNFSLAIVLWRILCTSLRSGILGSYLDEALGDRIPDAKEVMDAVSNCFQLIHQRYFVITKAERLWVSVSRSPAAEISSPSHIRSARLLAVAHACCYRTLLYYLV